MKTKNIAIVQTAATSPGLLQAIELTLKKKYPDATFVTVTKITDAPEGASIGGLGLPSFIPGDDAREVLSVGTVRTDDEAAKKAQWETIRGKDSTCEQIAPHLQGVESMVVLNGRALGNLRAGLSEHRVAIAEAETPEAKLAAALAGFEFLKGFAPV